VGELVATIVREQFAALRDGDRYWYANVLGRRERDQVEGIRLSDVIRANTAIGAEIPDNVFHRGHPAGGRRRRGERSWSDWPRGAARRLAAEPEAASGPRFGAHVNRFGR
jgi:hypothetical protein